MNRSFAAVYVLELMLCVGSGAGSRCLAQQGTPDSAQASTSSTGPARGGGVLLDAPVSRTAYLLGPGDVVDVAVFGAVNRVHTVSVTPEGSIVIPTIGVTRVLGLNLNDAQTRVRDLVLRLYRDVDVRLTLSQLRSFKVFVVGNVPNPGVRVASTATRVSEIIPPGGNGAVPRRNVLLRRASGDTLYVDLVRFVQTGDLSANPTLREGDALIVPTTDEVVQVFGRVFFPGSYEYRRGESLAELLNVANGGQSFPSNAADTVRVTRFRGNDERETIALPRTAALGQPGRAFLLQPFDAIFVSELANYRQQRTATIQGQVQRPGTYPIRPDTTTVRELVALAGGFTAEASLVDATLRRQQPGTQGEEARRLQSVPPELLSDDERRILQTRAQGGDPSNVVIDFRRLFAEGGSALDQTVESGDVLTVPTRREGVTVLGAVANPGIVPFIAGRGADHYVRLAGGYGRRADRDDVAVLKARLGNRTDARDVASIDPGDQIIVPFRERGVWVRRLQTTQALIGTLSGFVLTAIGLYQLLRRD